MRLQIEPSEKIVRVHGTECRLWYGVTPEGAKCFVFVATIGVPDFMVPGQDERVQESFQRELRELPGPPGEEAVAVLNELFRRPAR